MVQFKIQRIPEILGENLNPSFFILNLNPSTASQANEEDITTIVMTWFQLIIILLIFLILFKKLNLIRRFK